jgi:hypothetical protein
LAKREQEKRTQAHTAHARLLLLPLFPYTAAWNRASRARCTPGAEWAVKEHLDMLGRNRRPMTS